jgi:uncharacterized RDD family membrane protein YckC
MENSYELTDGQDQQEHLLDDIEYTYTQARSGKRFANYLIDRVAFYILWRTLFQFFTLPIASALYRTSHNKYVITLELYLMAGAGFVLFITAFEAITKGKTIGKWITGTRAVTADGYLITPKTALLRSLSRLVPFELFSALGDPSYPWHDRWTRTIVIVEKLSNLPPETI